MKKYFNKPRIISIVGDVNEAKSMLIYNIIKELRKDSKFNLVTFGLRKKIPYSSVIHSLEELEECENSIIFVDEYDTIFDLDNRKKKRQVEQTLRLINHKNNILVLVGLPENFKKFISNKLDVIMYKKCKLGDFINGSRIKNVCMSYKGYELGSSTLNIDKGKVLVFDGKHYKMVNIDYLKEYDTKLKNKPLLVDK